MLNLQLIRKERRLSQQQLADKLGVSRSTVAMWETGNSEPDLETLWKISEYFNVTTDYLLGLTDTPEKQIDEDSLPDHFETPAEAMAWLLEQEAIMSYSGIDFRDLSEDAQLEFANAALEQLKLLSYKYKK